MSWNPFKTWRNMKEIGNRLKGKNVEGNLVGDGLIVGGSMKLTFDGKVEYEGGDYGEVLIKRFGC